MQRCASCGTELPDNARFCTHCGQTLSPPSASGGTLDEQNVPGTGTQPFEDLAKLGTQPLSAYEEQEQEISARLVAEDSHTPNSQSHVIQEEEESQPLMNLSDLSPTEVPEEEAQPTGGNEPESESEQVSNVPTSKLNGAAPPLEIAQEPQPSVSSKTVAQEPEPSTASATTAQEAEPPGTSTAIAQEASSSDDPAAQDDAVVAVTPAQQAAAPAVKRKRRAVPAWLVIGIVAIVIIAGGAGALLFLLHPFSATNAGNPVVGTSPTSDTVPTATITACPGSNSINCTPSTLSNSTVDLAFSGAVAGHMTVTSVIACGAEQSVAGGQQYHVSILGTINGQQYGFSFDAYPYTHAGTYTGNVNSFFGPAGDSSSLTQWSSASTRSDSMTVSSNGKSGMLSMSLVSSSDHSTVGVVGTWTCA